MGREDSGYEHYIPMVAEDNTWETKVTRHLVHSIDELKQAIEENKDKKYVAFDTETTGLNADVDKIVGFSFAFSRFEGWYVPIRHIVGRNLDPKEALSLLYDLLVSKVVCFEYNMRFDTRMMEVEGFDMSKVPYYDVQVGVFCSDTNWKKTGLKLAERRWLGWTADTFTETLGENENFSYLDPEECYPYAVDDAMGTFGVAEKTLKYYKESGVAGRVLNEVQYPFMKCEDIKFRIDKDYLEKCQIEVIETLKEYEHDIYNSVGYQFKINSNKQLGDALQSLGINTNAYTAGGQMKVDIPTLELVNRELKSPLITKLIEYSQLFKQYNSYILSLIKQGEENQWKLRFHYMLGSVPTGRVASGQDRKNAYFANLNVMAIPKPHSKMYYVHDYKEGDEVPEGDFVILRWRFSSTDKSDWITEGQDQHLNMRSAFLPHEGHYIVAMDYSAQELVCQANLANVKNWVETFNLGGDLHEKMAKVVWGEENYNKDRRKKAKALNFGLLYGMSAYTMKDRINESIDDTKKIIDKYWKGCPEIPAYQQAVLRKAKKEGTIYTYFGLPRRVKYWLESSDPKKRAFGQRTCYDELTEVLTPTGWKLLKDISNGDIVAQYEDGEYKFVKATDKIEVESDEAIVFESRSVSLRVTPNHRMMISYDKKNWNVKLAEELVGNSYYYFKAAAKRQFVMSDKLIDSPLGLLREREFVKFIGWHITDGSLDIDKRNESRSVKISQKKEQNFEEIRSVCIGFSEYKTEKGSVWVKTDRSLFDYLVDFYGGRLKVDRSLPEWFMNLGNDSLEDFLFALLKADGTFHNNGADLYHPSFKLIEQVQLICMNLGYRSKITRLKEKSGTEIGRLQITFSDVVSIDGRERKGGTRQIRREIVNKERFYCVSVPSTFLIVRRNGKISVQGNCANTMIQGSCSTITLLALLKVYHKLYDNPDWKDDCTFFSYIHDEIVSSVKKERVEEFIPIYRDCMQMSFKGLPVPFRTSVSIGTTWGCQIEFIINDDGTVVPDMERVKE